MLVRRPTDIRSSEITDEKLYLNRRRFIKAASAGALAFSSLTESGYAGDWKPKTKGPYDTDEELTPYDDITTYNNFVEFGPNKDDPSKNAHTLRVKPWSVKVEGEVKSPATYNLEDLIKPFPLEDRIYRHRCVEGWSIVVPWLGFSLGDLIKRLEPTSKAKYVQFTTLYAPDQMPGQRRDLLPWPYVEGLRLDEAMHPLAILSVGLYGKPLPNQDGAPLRLVVPWKYGFKSIKSIVKIRFQEPQPRNSWAAQVPREYGFYANVNPNVDHPRWSQAKERRLGEFFRRKTLMFNGYADQVGQLYANLDLRKNY